MVAGSCSFQLDVGLSSSSQKAPRGDCTRAILTPPVHVTGDGQCTCVSCHYKDLRGGESTKSPWRLPSLRLKALSLFCFSVPVQVLPDTVP